MGEGECRSSVKFHRQAQASGEIARAHINGNLPYADSLESLLANALSYTFLVENGSAYETLKARGLDLITNDSLRAEIARLYDVLYEAIEENEIQILDHHRGALKPYYVTHLRDLEIESTTPREYTALVQDQEYAHLIAWSGVLRGLTLPVHIQVQRG